VRIYEDWSGAGEDFADIEPSHVTNTGLEPTLESGHGLENVLNSSVVLGDNPSASAVLDAVANEFPLNRKQRLVAERIIQGALTWKDYPYDSAKRDQLLMHIGGEGGTGKSQIIKAIVAGLRILKRDQEIILLAPTGAAADNIGCNTIHTALGMTIGTSTADSTIMGNQNNNSY
jgi:AAA domain